MGFAGAACPGADLKRTAAPFNIHKLAVALCEA